MSKNIFFDTSELKKFGKNAVIGKTVRIRYPELVEIGDNVIIDDFCYISTSLKIASNVHISSGCKLIGGRDASVEFGEFSTLSPNVVIAAGSDDYISGIGTPIVPTEFKGNYIVGHISIGRHCIIGSNTTILPNVNIAEGSSVGANSLVKENLKPWVLYAGIPAKAIRNRERDKILHLEKLYWDSLNDR